MSIALLAVCGCGSTAKATPNSPVPTDVQAAATDATTAAPSSTPANPTPTASATLGPRSNPAAPMTHGRVGFDAVLLGDGTVLAVGDDHDCFPGGAIPGSERVELYDPGSDTWTEMPSLNKPRKLPATVVLRDGTAMVVGGINSDDQPFSSTKIFSPSTRGWRDGPLLDVARSLPFATMLDDGRVLVVSWQSSRARSTSEIYDPGTGHWSTASALEPGIEIQEMEPIQPLEASFEGVPVEGAEVLALGLEAMNDKDVDSLQIYDPTREEWGALEPPDDARFTNLVALADGGALALGGVEQGRSVQRLDPKGEWSSAAPMSSVRLGPIVVGLADGRILVAGGSANASGDVGAALRTTEIYDPALDRWSAGPDLLEPRQAGSGVLLLDGSVLILGGNADYNTEGDTPWCPSPLTSVERLYPVP